MSEYKPVDGSVCDGVKARRGLEENKLKCICLDGRGLECKFGLCTLISASQFISSGVSFFSLRAGRTASCRWEHASAL